MGSTGRWLGRGVYGVECSGLGVRVRRVWCLSFMCLASELLALVVFRRDCKASSNLEWATLGTGFSTCVCVRARKSQHLWRRKHKDPAVPGEHFGFLLLVGLPVDTV